MNTQKTRVIQDYEKLSDELKDQVKLVYPEGFSQYLIKFSNAKGEKVSALRFETFEKIYLIRMSVEKALQIVLEDEDFDEDGVLKDEIKDKFEDEYADVEYLSENENYEEDEED
jgi:hypothetical protein